MRLSKDKVANPAPGPRIVARPLRGETMDSPRLDQASPSAAQPYGRGRPRCPPMRCREELPGAAQRPRPRPFCHVLPRVRWCGIAHRTRSGAAWGSVLCGSAAGGVATSALIARPRPTRASAVLPAWTLHMGVWVPATLSHRVRYASRMLPISTGDANSNVFGESRMGG